MNDSTSIYSGILSKVKTTSSSIFNKKSTIGFFESTKKWRLWGPSFCWTYCQTKNGMLFARSGTISKGLLPFPRTPSTRCALENLKINQVNLTWSGFKHPRFRRVFPRLSPYHFGSFFGSDSRTWTLNICQHYLAEQNGDFLLGSMLR